MKKIIVLIMAAALLLCTVSCGEADDPTDTTSGKTAEKHPASDNSDENPNDLEIDFKN